MDTTTKRTGFTVISTADYRLTVRSHRTGRVRVYRVYRDGHWELDATRTPIAQGLDRIERAFAGVQS